MKKTLNLLKNLQSFVKSVLDVTNMVELNKKYAGLQAGTQANALQTCITQGNTTQDNTPQNSQINLESELNIQYHANTAPNILDLQVSDTLTDCVTEPHNTNPSMQATCNANPRTQDTCSEHAQDTEILPNTPASNAPLHNVAAPSPNALLPDALAPEDQTSVPINFKGAFQRYLARTGASNADIDLDVNAAVDNFATTVNSDSTISNDLSSDTDIFRSNKTAYRMPLTTNHRICVEDLLLILNANDTLEFAQQFEQVDLADFSQEELNLLEIGISRTSSMLEAVAANGEITTPANHKSKADILTTAMIKVGDYLTPTRPYAVD